MALLRHVQLPYSAASDEKLLETSHCLSLEPKITKCALSNPAIRKLFF